MSQFKTIIGMFLLTVSAFAESNNSGGGSSSGGSGGGNVGFMQRAAARESKRWTLQEWMSQKNSNALMDQWLVMNSPSPFEFMIGGAYLDYKSRVDSPASETNYTSTTGEVAAYAQATGLSVDYENNGKENMNEVTGLFNFRILGNSLQSTSITLGVGQRTRTLSGLTPSLQFKNTATQIRLQSYFTKYFGLEGFYRYYFPIDDSTLGQISGSRSEAGLFIDFKAVRIFGSWFQDIEDDKSSTTANSTKRTGLKSGLKIYF